MDIYSESHHLLQIPNSTPIACNSNVPQFYQDAHCRSDNTGQLSLAHDIVDGAELQLYFWCAQMQKWIKAFPAGAIETVPGFTMARFRVPIKVLIYIQLYQPGNVYVGNATLPDGNYFPAPVLP